MAIRKTIAQISQEDQIAASNHHVDRPHGRQRRANVTKTVMEREAEISRLNDLLRDIKALQIVEIQSLFEKYGVK